MGKAELKIEIDEALLEQARAAHIDPATVFERALRERLAQHAPVQRTREWAAANAEAIRDHQDRIAVHGVFGDDLRTW